MTWTKPFEAYATVTRLWEKPDIHKLSMLVLYLGGEGYRICQSRPGPKSTMEEMIESMTRHYKPLSSVSRDRVIFFGKSQGSGEVETYTTLLRVSMGDCQFQKLEDEITRDVFIQGLNEDRIRDRILADPERTFKQTVEKARALEGNSPRAVRGSGSPSRQAWSRETPIGPKEEGRMFRSPDVPPSR